jgi:hypothetical protein
MTYSDELRVAVEISSSWLRPPLAISKVESRYRMSNRARASIAACGGRKKATGALASVATMSEKFR